LSNAVAEPEKKAEPRLIKHREDRGMLEGFLASFCGKLDDPELVNEYFEYREIFGSGFGKLPGPMDRATLQELAVRYKRRLDKKKAKDAK
jgi:hypothetical protein